VDGLYQDENGYYGFDGEDAETFSAAHGHVGRNNGPALLFDLTYNGVLDVEQHPGVVAETWTMAEFSAGKLLDTAEWVELFETAGYTHNGQPSPRPKQPVTLYRGCAPERRFGMSWTTHVDRARWFADRNLGHGTGNVYVYQAEPFALLAFIDESGRGEAEYVIDPAYLSDDTVELLEMIP